MNAEQRLDELTQEALDEFSAEYETPDRLPGDIDAKQIMERLGCSFSTARLRMKEKVETGNWEELTVSGDRGNIFIIRKVPKP